MARYLVIHEPKADDDESVRAPTRLLALARASQRSGASPRWLRAWSPDLHDDRIFSLWEAENAAEIQAMLEHYGFLDHLAARPLRVREWGPEEVIAAEDSLG
ncbi:MAG TPA: hypothetical protein VFQ80_14090 [Thermomicrobiales bacterium]|nr:hypothetical protein [Thermomicrobiales bacterium]